MVLLSAIEAWNSCCWRLGKRDSAGGVSQCNYPSLTGISVATVIIFPCKEEINLYRCIWGVGDCPEEEKKGEERPSHERGRGKIEDGWLVIGLRAGLVCLFAWLAAVRVVVRSVERHNEKCVFEFNSLLSFITVFQTRAQNLLYWLYKVLSESLLWNEFKSDHYSSFSWGYKCKNSVISYLSAVCR